MHMCASTEEDLGTRSGTASTLKSSMDAKVSTAKGLSSDMQNFATKLQKSFGAVGDSGASGLAEEADEAAKALGKLVTDGNGLSDFTKPETVTKAERIMEGIDEAVAAGEAVTD